MRLPQLIVLAGLSLPAITPATAQETVVQISTLSSQYRLADPVCLAISPTGSRFAISDRHQDRVFVFDIDARLTLALGEQVPLTKPRGLVFENDVDILVYLEQPRGFFRVSTLDATVFDTISLTPDSGQWTPDRIERFSDGSLALLSVDQSRIWLADAALQTFRLLVDQGQGRGRIWGGTDIAVDLSGRLLASDSRNFPMQAFNSSGALLLVAGWNDRAVTTPWEATAVAVDRTQTIWLSDSEHQQFRLFDGAGLERDSRPFGLGMERPVDMVFTPDGRLLVLEERGNLLVAGVE